MLAKVESGVPSSFWILSGVATKMASALRATSAFTCVTKA
jgi:hypothetical protein